jgi:hypothetical protein
MQATIENRSLWDALIWEPLALVKDQPPQVLISLASAALVAVEAEKMLTAPWHVLLAAGAEWAYLRGLCSTQAARSRWSAGLIASGLALVGFYGFLAGIRKLGVQLPGEGAALATDAAVAGAVLITLVHILPVIALGICSAMCHRVEALAIRAERQKIADEATARTAALVARQQTAEDAERAWREQKRQRDEAYAAELQAKRDAQQIELEALYKKTQIEESVRAARLAARHANARPASLKMQSDARSESMNAEAQDCPKCGAHIESRSAWLAARRWQRCKNCKEAN